MIDHDAAREALLDGGELAEDVRAHLESCADCREIGAALSGLDTALASLPAVPPSEALFARTLARIDAEDAASKRAPGALRILAIAAGAILGGLWSLLAGLRARGPSRRRVLVGAGLALPAAAALGLSVLATREGAEMRYDDQGLLPRLPSKYVDPGVDTPVDQSEVTVDGLPVQGNEQDQAGDDLRARLAYVDEATEPSTESGDLYAMRDEDGLRGPSHSLEDDELGRDRWARPDDDEETTGDAQRAQTGEHRNAELADNRRSGGEQVVDQGIARGEHRVTLDALTPGFFAARMPISGLRFVEPNGYWASTYVPGDPELRLLRRRLADAPEALGLAQRAEPADLALDAPSHGALALDVRADQAAVEGPTRVTLSVGLRGAAAHNGRRPTLRTEVVIDARRPLTDDEEARVRALLGALGRSRAPADRIGVLVAGPHGGELLPMGELRAGEVTIALRRMHRAESTEALALDAALARAATAVGEPEALGSGLVVLLTPGLGAADAQSSAATVHTASLAGITTTAIGLSDAAPLAPLEEIALSGQGRRRILGTPSEADALVRDEIEAVSRVVARAVRLRIRLADGVSLVDVLGSHRLDDDETRRVREAERTVDRELARRLGIVSDRGDDEDGIQMVIPAFYAGDEHAVLLDLVVPGPGPVADVSVRFKDLLRLDNGADAQRLALPRGERRPGPRERGVTAQLVAHEVAAALRAAASELAAGRPDRATARIAAAETIVRDARAALPALSADRRLARDLELCAAYRSALASGTDTAALADSLRYASRRRLYGDPLALDAR